MEVICKNDGILFDAKKNHVRCIAHVMNRVVGDILKAMRINPQGEDELIDNEEAQSDEEDITSKVS